MLYLLVLSSYNLQINLCYFVKINYSYNGFINRLQRRRPMSFSYREYVNNHTTSNNNKFVLSRLTAIAL